MAPYVVAPDMRLCEPVSVTYRTGLRHVETEIGKWRAETDARKPPAGDQKPQIAGQRLGHTSLTRRNVGGSPTPGTHDAETALAGWGGRIRTSGWRNQNPEEAC